MYTDFHFKITLKIKEFIFSLAFYSNHSSITPVHVAEMRERNYLLIKIILIAEKKSSS